MAEPLQIAVGDARTSGCIYAPAGAPEVSLLFAHGAGADQHHPFIVRFAEGLAARGVEVVTFNFLYTEARRRVPDRNPLLEATFRAALDAVRGRRRLAIGGKSMGGRIASQVVAGLDGGGVGAVAGLVFIGYPLHPPKRPAELRTAHLPGVRAPMLFVQGERDPFGGPDELAPILAPLRAELFAVAGGDHSLSVRRRDGAQADVDAAVQNKVAAWLRAL